MALNTRALSCGRRRRVVLTPRRWRQVGGRDFTDDGGKKARSPGRARNKPQNHRAGNAGCSGVPVVTNSCVFYLCTRGCGRFGRPAFPVPSVLSRVEIPGQLGRATLRDRGGVFKSAISLKSEIKMRPVTLELT